VVLGIRPALLKRGLHVRPQEGIGQ